MNREIEAPDDIKLECCRQHEDQHRNAMGRRKYERPIRRIEHYPRDERGHGGEPQTDANAAEQACKQDRRGERHGTKALAHPAEEPTKTGGKENEGAAEYYAERRPISRKLPEGK